MAIDYGRLISRTWEVFSRNRVLWLLGLIVGLTSGGFNTQFDFTSYNSNGSRVQEFLDQYGSLLLGLGCVAIIIGIIFSFISAAGQAALVATTDHIERTHQQPSFAESWGLGWPKMFPVWMFNLIFGIITLIIVCILLLPFFLLFGGSIMAAVGSSGSSDDTVESALAGALGLGCICLCVGLIILIPLSIALGIAREYGLRAVVLENEGAFQAIGTGWRMLRANLGSSVITFLITVVVGIITAVVLSPVLLVLGAPMMASLGLGNGTASLIMAFFLGTILWIISALVAAFTQSFESVLWTLLYRNLRQMPGSELAPAGVMPPGGGTPYGAPYGAAPPYNPASGVPPYTPPSANPPPYAPPADSPPPYTPPAGNPPPYTPPAGNPPPYTPPPGGAGTVQYGAPPPYTPPSETRPLEPPMPDDRARGPEGGSGI